MKSKFLISLITLAALLLNTSNVKAQFGADHEIQEVAYQPKLLKKSFPEIKSILEQELLKFVSYTPETETYEYYQRPPKSVLVFDDRIEMNYKRKNSIIKFFFKELENDTIAIIKTTYSYTSINSTAIYYKMKLGDLTFQLKTVNDGHLLADCLFTINYNLMDEKIVTWLNDFKPVADNYRSLTEKPAITEEQREYIVQANLFTQQKNYNKAIELYQKVIQINPISFPAAYSNLALLYANLADYQSAIYYMKLYLMLEPEALDARASQDKIYEWKAML